MTARGAPCIASVYILSIRFAELNHKPDSIIATWTIEDLLEFQVERHKKINHVRPTAVNLNNAMSGVKSFIEDDLPSDPAIPMDHSISELTHLCTQAINAGTKVNECIGQFGCDGFVEGY